MYALAAQADLLRGKELCVPMQLTVRGVQQGPWRAKEHIAGAPCSNIIPICHSAKS